MTCPNCGAQNDPGFRFCKACGTELTQAAPQPQQPQYQVPQQLPHQAPAAVAPKAPRKNPFADLIRKIKSVNFGALLKDPKKLAIPAAAVAAVLILVILISIIGSAGKGACLPKMTHFAVEVDGEYMLLRDDEILEEGMGPVDIRDTSMDGSVDVYKCEDELFVVRNGQSIHITDDFVARWTILSADGSALLVLDNDSVLTSYSTKNGEGTEIAEDVVWFCVSPDGKSVVYLVYDDGDRIAYLHKGKDSIELGEALLPITVSNGAKVIYCIDEEKRSLCTVDAKGNIEKIASDVDDDCFFMNEDHTQMIFWANGKWYATVKGGEKIKLTSDVDFYPLNYQDAPVFSSGLVHTYPTGDLRGSFVELDDSVAYINKDWELEKVAKDVEFAMVSADGKTLTWLRDNGKLYKATTAKLHNPIELAEDVWDFAATPDGSAVYYINEDEELIWQKGTKEGKRIADDVDYVFTTHDGYCFYESDDELFSVKDGGKKVRIADDLYDIYITGSVFYLWTDYEDGEFNFYACTKGNKFKELYTY